MSKPSKKAPPVLELQNVSKDYYLGEVKLTVLQDLSLKIFQGDFVALVGVSGSGKTTAMNILGCLDNPTHGKVFIDGQNVSHMSEDELAHVRSNKIGFVFQQFNLLKALSCEENIALPLIFKKENRKFEVDEKVKELIEEVGLGHRKNHRPLEMSGGEQQRAAIARALVGDPEIILADEPTGTLDSKTGKMVIEIFKKLNKEGKTIIIVTHDHSIAKEADKIFNMKDGRLVKDGHEIGKLTD